jgi:hypothetical protein
LMVYRTAVHEVKMSLYLFMFGREPRMWYKKAEICLSLTSIEGSKAQTVLGTKIPKTGMTFVLNKKRLAKKTWKKAMERFLQAWFNYRS